MVYSTTPYIIPVDTSIYAIVCLFSVIVCVASLCSAIIGNRSKVSDYFVNLCLGCIVVFFISACISIYKESTTQKVIDQNQHKVTATLVSVSSKEVSQPKGRIDTVVSALYRVDNGDLIALPIKYGVSIHQNVFLYVKDNQ